MAYSVGEDPEWNWYEELLQKYKPALWLDPERFDPHALEDALSRAGFRGIRAQREQHTVIFSTFAELWGWLWSHGDRGVLESLTGNRETFKQELEATFNGRAGHDGLPYTVYGAVTVAEAA